MQAQQAINAFMGINGKDLLPQIYIPFYEELKAAGKLGAASPVVVLHPGNSTATEVPGYTLDRANKLVPMGKMIDEAYAMEHEIWVVSLNERVNSLEDAKKMVDSQMSTHKSANLKASTTATALAAIGPDFYIEKMRLKEHLEGWLSGENDVRFTGLINYANAIDPSGQSSPVARLSDQNGVPVSKFSKSDTRYDTQKTVNFRFYETLDASIPKGQTPGGGVTPGNGNAIWFVLFEYDAWPESIKSVGITSYAGINYNVAYRSAESSLYAAVFYFDGIGIFYAGAANGNNNRIEFNTIDVF